MIFVSIGHNDRINYRNLRNRNCLADCTNSISYSDTSSLDYSGDGDNIYGVVEVVNVLKQDRVSGYMTSSNGYRLRQSFIYLEMP